ncbi:MAG TPA: hypothetical protein VFM90_04475, partial [Cyclobacteriaceae bacterium]|nr:hypothetical protein [Cyclobacteriaceae bacterium]
MSDNELDNLFKEAAQGFTPPQDESAWQQMAARLDKTPVPGAGFWNWKTVSVLTATGLIAVTAVWFATTRSETVSAERAHEGIAKTHQTNEPANTTQDVVQKQEEHPHAAGDKNFTAPQPLEDESRAPGDRVNRSVTANKRAAGKQTPQREENIPVHHAQDAGSSRAPVPAVSTENESARLLMPVPEENKPENRLSETSRTTATRTLPEYREPGDDSVKLAQHEHVPTDSVSQSDRPDGRHEKIKTKGVFSVKAVVSPDFSSVNFFSPGKTGINYGLLAGYSFNNNRWSVYTGVISSKKLYATNEVEGSYNWDGHDYPVKELDGDCRILDIPVNVYYTF